MTVLGLAELQLVEVRAPDETTDVDAASAGVGQDGRDFVRTMVEPFVGVAAPDEATAAVFRAALALTARRRATDQLIRIVVD